MFTHTSDPANCRRRTHSTVMVIHAIIETEQKITGLLILSLFLSALWCHSFFLPFHSKAPIHKWPRYHTVLERKAKGVREKRNLIQLKQQLFEWVTQQWGLGFFAMLIWDRETKEEGWGKNLPILEHCTTRRLPEVMGEEKWEDKKRTENKKKRVERAEEDRHGLG